MQMPGSYVRRGWYLPGQVTTQLSAPASDVTCSCAGLVLQVRVRARARDTRRAVCKPSVTQVTVGNGQNGRKPYLISTLREN